MKNYFKLSLKINYYYILIIIFKILLIQDIYSQTTITGNVFNDSNNDGIRNASEVGYPYVVVNAYAPGATTPTATTNTLATPLTDVGNYTISGLTAGTTYRLEFINPDGYFNGSFGIDSKSSVQFATSGSSNINFGFRLSGVCSSESNPRIIVGASNWTGNGSFNGQDPPPTPTKRLMSWKFLDKYSNANLYEIHPHSDDIGFTIATPYSLTVDKKNNIVYFTTVNSPVINVYGSNPIDGYSAIYAADYSGINNSFVSYKLLIKLSDIGINVSNQYPFGTETSNSTFGASGLNGINITNDSKFLYIINAGNGKIVKLDISSVIYNSLPASAPTISNVSEISIPDSITNVLNGRFRPTALNIKGNKLLIGGVNDGSLGSDSDVNILVLEMDLNTNVFKKIFNYNAISFSGGELYSSNLNSQKWSTVNYPLFQPYVNDFDFADNGDLLIGIGNRRIFTNQTDPRSTGYLLRANLNINGTYTIENNGVSGAYTSSANNSYLGNSGPGNKWFFEQGLEVIDPTSQTLVTHYFQFSGGIANVSGSNYFLAGNVAPINITTTGVRYYNPNSGITDSGINLGNTKSFSITGMESVCDIIPIEIGNRVWKDTNGNGIQDANEPSLVGVTVCLYNSTNMQVATAVSDINGNYIFSSAAGTNTASFIYGLTLNTGSNYTLKICSLGSDPSVSGLTLSNLSIAPGELSGQLNSQSTLANNDAFLINGTPTIPFVLGNPGENNHNYDFGFTLIQNCSVSLTANPSSCNPTDNKYTLTGTIQLTNPPSSGALTIQIVGGGSQTFDLSLGIPTSYSIANQNSDGAIHTVDLTISSTSCASSTTYTAPASCSINCPIPNCGTLKSKTIINN